jgi:hypothetical protein
LAKIDKRTDAREQLAESNGVDRLGQTENEAVDLD